MQNAKCKLKFKMQTKNHRFFEQMCGGLGRILKIGLKVTNFRATSGFLMLILSSYFKIRIK